MGQWRQNLNKAYSEVFLYKGAIFTARVSSVLLVFLMLVTFVTVFTRRLLPGIAGALMGGYEFSMAAMALLTPLAIGYAWYEGSHVRIGVLRDKLAPNRKAIIDVISTIVGILYCLFWIVGLSLLAKEYIAVGRASELRQIPMAPFMIINIVGIVHVFFVMTRSLVGLFSKAIGRSFGVEPYLKSQ